MNKEKILTGSQLVAKGATKLEATLPEIGLKEVVPNGSWLEQKQIQAALEAKKHLVEVERIEKSGVLSHAEWQDELQLAEVTQKVGSYWQYIGHNVGKQLYLYPEEAIFLMEVNCLQLKYNDITVSLQQAYSLLLKQKVTLMHYKVYATLSRFGYKVFRYKDTQSTNYEKKCKVVQNTENICKDTDKNEHDLRKEGDVMNDITTSNKFETINISDCNNEKEEKSDLKEVVIENVEGLESTDKNSEKVPSIENNSDCANKNLFQTEKIQTNHSDCSLQTIKEWILHKLNSRRNTFNRDAYKGFENVPDFTENRITSIKAPEEQHIPRNVFLNNTAYIVNIDNIKSKSIENPTNSRTYSISDEVNGEHIRRVRDSTSVEFIQSNWNSTFDSNTRFRQFNNWRPRTNFNFFPPFHLFFQRPFLPNVYFGSRFHFFPRAASSLFRQFSNIDNFSMNINDRNMSHYSRKRTRNNLKRQHLENIKRLALRLKQSILTGSLQPFEAQALHRLLLTYNTRYKTRLRITEQIDIIEDENIIETIELDDDEETKSKKPRVNDNDSFTDNIKQLKQLAFKLKVLEGNLIANSKHRRALSNAIKTFNNSFNADVYLNNDYKIIDRRHITLASTSDSDCIIEEIPDNKKPKPGRMVKNPFSIMKNLSQHDSLNSDPSTSKDSNKASSIMNLDVEKYNYNELSKIFRSEWLPKKEDFGRAEVPFNDFTTNYLIGSKQEEYLYDLIKSQSMEFENWVDIKIAFWENINESPVVMQCNLDSSNDTTVNSLLKLEDCTDMPSILNKLRIINTNKEIDKTSLNMDFDVYNKDIQNFKKSNRPKPHFRVICLAESTNLPSGAEIASLHSKYDDDVTIMFAIVGIGSISFVQMNPTELPMYIPNSDLP